MVSVAVGVVGAQESVLIPELNRRDHVYDSLRDILYISTTAGTVARYDVENGSLLVPFGVGLSLNGIDLSPDSRFLYVAESLRGAFQGFVRKVDAETGSVTNLQYPLDFGEGGAWDIGIGAHGKGLLSTRFEGSGSVPFRELVLATDALIARTDVPSFFGEVGQDTSIVGGASRTFFLMLEANSSQGPVFTYDTASDTFVSDGDTGESLSTAMAAVNRDGTLAAVEIGGVIHICDRDLNTIELVAGDAGLVFHPHRDILLVAQSATDEIIAYDTRSWEVAWRGSIGEDVPVSRPMGNGEMSIHGEGDLVFISTPSGIRAVSVVVPPITIFADGFESGDSSAWTVMLGS